ncbi:MAG TPA: FHA domain-containing protein, partial [Kofleriaceae bacterium]|nr:FHA domain-containing protein [Kofleriaceae bacterium]
MLLLEILRGTATRPSYELSAPVITLGRASTNTIVLTDYHLSGEHAQILREGNGYVFRDLRSTNGSAVERGGTRIPVDASRRHELGLEPGDLLLLGDSRAPVQIRVKYAPSDDTELAERLIATRSIVDLPAVRDQIERAPVSALRVYKAIQRLSGR